SLYTIHAYTDDTRAIDWRELDEIKICSIDMGRVNFGMQVETRTWNKTRKKVKVVREFILKEELEPSKTSGISYFYKQFSDMIEEHHDVIADCNLVLIEKQLCVVGKGKGGNVKTYRDMQHLITYFQLFPFNQPCHIVELSPRVKTKYLRCPATITGHKI